MPTADGAALAACVAAVVASQQDQLRLAAQQGVIRQLVDAVLNAVQPSGTATPSASTTPEPSRTLSPSSAPTRDGQGTRNQAGINSAGTNRTGAGSTDSSLAGARGAARQSTLTVPAADAAITKADITLSTAETQLKAATMRAPISGTVAAVPFVKGEVASTSDQIVVIGRGSVTVTMAVNEAAFRTLQVGQATTLAVPGGAHGTGKVSTLGLLPSSATTGATTFPVTVTATGKSATALAAGSVASATVTLGTSKNVVVVPVSAVTRTGPATGSASVLDHGTLRRVTLTLGRLGQSTIEVRTGLTVGQQVVLADNATALPSAAANRRGLTGGGANGPGAGGPGAGGGAPPGGR